MVDDDPLADFSSALVAPTITNEFDSFESNVPSATNSESSAQQTSNRRLVLNLRALSCD